MRWIAKIAVGIMLPVLGSCAEIEQSERTEASRAIPQERNAAVLRTLERLREAQGGAIRSSTPLNEAEQSLVREHIVRCLSRDMASFPPGQRTFGIRLILDTSGRVRDVVPHNTLAPVDQATRDAYNTVRRHFLSDACRPFPLPENRLSAIMATVFTFSGDSTTARFATGAAAGRIEAGLLELQRLRERGLITPSEYDAARARILRDL